MAGNTIRIKRSATSATVPTLANGELAFTEVGNTLYIGAPSGSYTNIPIGGKYNYGVLTANQALVANSTSGIDRVVVANVELSKLSANGSWGNPGYILTSAGSTANAYWQAVAAIGVDPNSQYTWTNTQLFTNSVSFSTNVLANAVYTNTISTGAGYASVIGGAIINATTIGVGNAAVRAYITTNSSVAFFTGKSYDAFALGGVDASYYTNTDTLAANLILYTKKTDLTANLGNYTNTQVLAQDYGSKLYLNGNYPNNTNLTDNLARYITISALTTTLGGYITTGQLTGNLALYPTKTNLTDNLARYVTTTTFNTTIANYINASQLQGNLAYYTTSADLEIYYGSKSYLTSFYVNTNQLTTALTNYPTKAEMQANAQAAYSNALANVVQNYPNNTQLTANLNNYTSKTDLTANLVLYLTKTDAGTNYVNTINFSSNLNSINSNIAANAATAYSNAVSYVDTRIGTIAGGARVNTAIVANADAAFANALNIITNQYVNTANFNANLARYAVLSGAVFTGDIQSIKYSTGTTYGSPAGGAVVNSTSIAIGNSTVNGAISTNATAAYFTGIAYNANTANNSLYLGGNPASDYASKSYVDNQVYGVSNGAASQTYADEKAANAYSNAVSYTDTKIAIVNAAIIANATSTFNQATAYTDSALGSVRLTITANAQAAYVNATTFATSAAAAAGSAAYTNAMATTLTRSGSYSGNNSFSGRSRFQANVSYDSGVVLDAPESTFNIRDVNVSGNLTVSGTLTTIDTVNIQVKDASIQLADTQANTANFTDAQDFAVFGTYGNTANVWYSGIYRDSSATSSGGIKAVWKLFTSNVQPSTTVDPTVHGGTAYKLGTLQAYLEPYGNTGAFIANSSAVTITASSLVKVNITANTINLATALTALNGGTGQTIYNTGDILYASSSTNLSKLSIPLGSPSGANGQVLQVINNLPQYDNLDGGVF